MGFITSLTNHFFVVTLFGVAVMSQHIPSPSRPSVTNIFSENRESSDRLIVTPYITRGEIERAQNLSRVTNFTRVRLYFYYELMFGINEFSLF